MQSMITESNDGPWWRSWELVALTVLVAGIYFTRLAAVPVCGEESRWATAAREMVASGDWIVPRQQGTIFPERPPLGSWAMAVVGFARGQIDLVAIRIPSALAMLATTVLIFTYASRWMTRVGAFAAAAAYATFGQVMVLGRHGESEALFTLFTGGALLVWHAIYVQGKSRLTAWLVGYSLAALGALVKGPQAPVYFICVTTGFLLLERNWRWLFGLQHMLGIVSFVAIVGAWFVPFALSNAGAVDDIWAGLAQDRFTKHNLLNHVLTYPFETFGCLLPWSPLVLALLNPRVFRTIAADRPQMRFLIVALVVTYPTVWFAAGARGRYYMPLYPCLAVLVGLVVEHCAVRLAASLEQAFWKHFQRGAAIAVGVIGLGVALAGMVPLQPLQEIVQSVRFLAFWIPVVLVSAALLVWASLGRGELRTRIAVLSLAAFMAVAHTGMLVNQRAKKSHDIDPLVTQLKQQLEDGRLISLGRVYHRFAYEFDEPIPQVDWPIESSDLPADVEYFCFDRRPGDTPESRSGSDARVPFSTPGTLPFAWEEITTIPCDPVQREVHNRSVVIGRVVRPTVVASLPDQHSRR
jgi:4-amino-4-deoxy-L-arabinose transferase-like glycosyltransferase